MAAGDGQIPPIDFLGGTNGQGFISPRREGQGLYDYIMAWIKYYYDEYDLGVQYNRSQLGPYVSGHRAITPLNPSGPSQAELIGQPVMYAYASQYPIAGQPVRNQRWMQSQYIADVSSYNLPTPSDPLAPAREPRNPAIFTTFGIAGATLIRPDQVWDGLLSIISKQSAISYTVFKYTVYGDGGNRGYYNPVSFNSTRQFTVFYNTIHRMKWSQDDINLSPYNETPYGNPLQTDPEATFNIPAWTKAWSVDIMYGTKNFSTRIDINQGNQPVPAEEMQIQFVPTTFPQTIIGPSNPGIPGGGPLTQPGLIGGPRQQSGAGTQFTRDNRIVQPRIRRYVNRSNYPNLSKDNIILRSDIARLVQEATRELFIGDYFSTTYFERIVCHASCHGSCHGSRGRR